MMRIPKSQGSLERDLLPCGFAERADVVAMIYVRRDAMEMERVGAFSCEECMTISSLHRSKADSTFLNQSIQINVRRLEQQQTTAVSKLRRTSSLKLI